MAEVVELVTVAVDLPPGGGRDWRTAAPGLAARRPRSPPGPWTRRLLHGALLAAIGPAEEAVTCLGDVIVVAERVGAVWPLIAARIDACPGCC